MTSPLWHPFTQHKTAGPMVKIARTEGAYLYTEDGRKIIDGIASWWINLHGHRHPKIVQAVRDQAKKMDQVIFAGFTHDAAEELAERLLARANGHFSHVFLSDSGSTAVEAALKMAIGARAQRGDRRRGIVALEGGYHGDTFGAMAAGARGVFSRNYDDYLFPVERVSPDDLDRLETIFKRGDTAAFIFEPLVQGAGGMLIYAPETLQAMLALCEQYGVTSIADEVMTGFGRTGTFFACEQAGGCMPDLMCLSKGLTNGYLPMGATLARREIYNAFYDTQRSKMFFHSSSFTGNPLACAAAVASLDIWETEDVQGRIETIAAAHAAAAPRFKNRDDVRDVRQCGSILALDIAAEEGGYLSQAGTELYALFLQRGLLLRPLGNTVYILPPYCVTQADLDELYDGLVFALDHLRHGRSERAA